MIYRGLRWIAGIMLHWFYSEMRVEGADRIPSSGPLLVAVNHPNAMVDSLVAGWVVPRRLRMTAKATLLNSPIVALLFRLLGVVPLRRASDSSAGGDQGLQRNQAAFSEIIGVLRGNGAVLIFPEGVSNSDELMPLKTGLARIAIEAKRSGVRGIRVVPIGLNFENKGLPGTRLTARVEEPIEVDSYHGESPHELTEAVAQSLSRATKGVAFPPARVRRAGREGLLVRAASWWGRTTHEIPIRYARSLAMSRSRSADEPAMLTMLFGMGLVIASYAIHVAVVGLLTRSFLLSAIYLATLVTGAYWTAFGSHRTGRN